VFRAVHAVPLRLHGKAIGAARISTARVLAMATTVAAAAIGRDEQIGRLRAGYEADLLTVSGDPLTDLRALHNVRCVIAAGRVHLPASGN
jgi:imidazolonepropionase-like amidohydrolase